MTGHRVGQRGSICAQRHAQGPKNSIGTHKGQTVCLQPPATPYPPNTLTYTQAHTLTQCSAQPTNQPTQQGFLSRCPPAHPPTHPLRHTCAHPYTQTTHPPTHSPSFPPACTHAHLAVALQLHHLLAEVLEVDLLGHSQQRLQPNQLPTAQSKEWGLLGCVLVWQQQELQHSTCGCLRARMMGGT